MPCRFARPWNDFFCTIIVASTHCVIINSFAVHSHLKYSTFEAGLHAVTRLPNMGRYHACMTGRFKQSEYKFIKLDNADNRPIHN